MLLTRNEALALSLSEPLSPRLRFPKRLGCQHLCPRPPNAPTTFRLPLAGTAAPEQRHSRQRHQLAEERTTPRATSPTQVGEENSPEPIYSNRKLGTIVATMT